MIEINDYVARFASTVEETTEDIIITTIQKYAEETQILGQSFIPKIIIKRALEYYAVDHKNEFDFLMEKSMIERFGCNECSQDSKES